MSAASWLLLACDVCAVPKTRPNADGSGFNKCLGNCLAVLVVVTKLDPKRHEHWAQTYFDHSKRSAHMYAVTSCDAEPLFLFDISMPSSCSFLLCSHRDYFCSPSSHSLIVTAKSAGNVPVLVSIDELCTPRIDGTVLSGCCGPQRHFLAGARHNKLDKVAVPASKVRTFSVESRGELLSLGGNPPWPHDVLSTMETNVARASKCAEPQSVQSLKVCRELSRSIDDARRNPSELVP